MTAPEITSLISAVALLLAGLGAREILPEIWVRLTGREDRERALIRELRAEVTDMQTKIDRLRADRDHQAARYRRVSEHASHLRRILYDLGHSGQVPDWPEGED